MIHPRSLRNMGRYNAYFHHNTPVTSWRTMMANFFLFPNGEESLSNFLSPDPDNLRGGASHVHNASCVKKSS